MLYKELLGFLSVILTCASYVPYIWSILKGRVKPHLFSFVIWTIVNGIAFAGQYTRGGGAGAWTTGVTTLLALFVVGLSIFYGEKNITKSDWVALVGGLFAILWWLATSDPLGAVILAIIIDIIGCYPTIRKLYNRPHEEAALLWLIASLRSGISIFALERYSVVTLIFPIAMIFTNGGLALLVLWRRQVCKIDRDSEIIPPTV